MIYRLDLQALEIVKESLQNGKEVDFGQLDYMKVELVHEIGQENHTALLDEVGSFNVQLDMKLRRLHVNFKDSIKEDQSETLIQKLDSLKQNKDQRAKLLMEHQPSDVVW